MIDDKGEQIEVGRPVDAGRRCSVCRPCPNAGDEFRVAPDEKMARTVGEAREHRLRLKHQRGDARVQDGRQARGHLQPDPGRRDRHPEPDPEGRRAGLARGRHREPAQARARRGRAGVRAPRRRRHHRERHHAGRHDERHDHRLQRPPGPQGPRAGRRRGRRDPHLRDHLQAARGHRAGDGRHAGAGVRGGRHRRGRGPRDLPGAADRRHRRLLRALGRHHPWLEGPLPPRRHDHLEGRDHVAQAVQGRRPRGPRGLRVRHRPVRLPGPQAGDLIETFDEREIAST